MRLKALVVNLFITTCLVSCNKNDDMVVQDTFVKNITSEDDFSTVGSLQLPDGNFLLVNADQSNSTETRLQGHMIKIDPEGNILWDKRLSEKNRNLFKVIPVPGTGFATFGCYSTNDTYTYICLYDNNGNLLSENRVNSGGPNQWFTPFDLILLSNGNYAVGYGDEVWYGVGHLKILDPSFNLISAKVFFPPSGYATASVHGMAELSDGSIGMMMRATHSNNALQFNLLYVRVTTTGNTLSYTFREDSSYSETTNAMERFGTGAVAVTAGMKADGREGGLSVNYLSYNSNMSALISGRISLVLYDESGNYTGRKTITGYPGNGQMNSIRKTSDGGYILCGTAGQANSFVVVSFTKMYVVKLDSQLNVLWARVINSEYPAFGIDAFEIREGGYLISGYQKSFNENYETVVIKTDGNGNF